MMAHDRVVHGRKDLLIIILKEKMNLDNLPQDLRTYISKYLQLFFMLIILGDDMRLNADWWYSFLQLAILARWNFELTTF